MYVVRLDGQVDDYSRDQLFHRFARAKKAGAKTIILEIDTYGGLVTSGLDISRFLKNQDVRTIAFVDSKAISAGAMIALACDEIVMKPSGTLGDCAPISVSDDGKVVPMGVDERDKALSPIRADFAESARRNNHSQALVLSMISAKLSVYWLQDAAGDRRFVDEAEYKDLMAAGGWTPVAGESNPIDGPDTLLTVHTEQAIRYGLAAGTAQSAEELAASRGLTIVDRYVDGVGDQLINLLATPGARLVFIIIFINALFIALKTPGTGAPEAIALVSLGLLVGMPLLTGFAQWWQAAMILIGLVLIVFEIFVFPGVLVGLLAGAVLLLGGIILTFVGDAWTMPGGWSLQGTWDGLERGLYITVGGLAASMLLFAWLRQFLPKLPYFNRLILTAGGPPVDVALDNVPTPAPSPPRANVSDDAWPFVGTVGAAMSDLKPGGTAQFPYGNDTRVTSVVCECGYLPAGSKIVVREVHGSHVTVRPAKTGPWA